MASGLKFYENWGDQNVAAYLITAHDGIAYGEDGDPMNAAELQDAFMKGCIIGRGTNFTAGFRPVNGYIDNGEVVLSYFNEEGQLQTISSVSQA